MDWVSRERWKDLAESRQADAIKAGQQRNRALEAVVFWRIATLVAVVVGVVCWVLK